MNEDAKRNILSNSFPDSGALGKMLMYWQADARRCSPTHNRDRTIIAALAEVDVDKKTGKISVRRITIAQDCGMFVNPDGVKHQI